VSKERVPIRGGRSSRSIRVKHFGPRYDSDKADTWLTVIPALCISLSLSRKPDV
jgi:hypothetical protein